MKNTCYKKIIFFAITLFICMLFVELGLRLIIYAKHKIPLHKQPYNLIYTYYWELKAVHAKKIEKNDEYFDVLILGASIFDIEYQWGKRAVDLLERKLPGIVNKPVRIHNVSRKAMSSLDSRIKFDYLQKKNSI